MNDAQQPGHYRIPHTVKLIIVDAHDTIFKPDLSRTERDIFNDPMRKERITWMLRDGFLNFIEYFKDQRDIDIVISSDGSKQRLTNIAKQFGVFSKLKAIYGAEHIDRWDYLKKLDKILEQCNVEAGDAVFIGDSDIDRFSAEKYGIHFIQVPNTVSNREFSFHSFLEIDFNSGDYGLDLVDLHGISQVQHNLSTPQLVEEVIRRKEGILAHLGPVVINEEHFQSAEGIDVHIVKEPSCENEINWNDRLLPFPMARYLDLFAGLKAFLQDRPVYIQDCYAGSEACCRIPLRIITQTAWPNLFARHMFRQATELEMQTFFPEYTLIHAPEFKVDAEEDEDIADNLILINLVRRLILVLGANSSNAIRKAVFLTLSFILPKNDMLPVRCSSNINHQGRLSLFFGTDHALKSNLSLNTSRRFFGDDCHGWTQEGFTNIEWGCRTYVDGLNELSDPATYSATRQFSTILENVEISPKRRLQFESQNQKHHSIASFPIAHLKNADRSGVAAFPRHLFILINDAMGVIPTLGQLTREQAAVYLLLGYGSEWNEPEGSSWPGIHFRPFYNTDPAIVSESCYTALLYEKLERSLTNCWIVNAQPLGPGRKQVRAVDQHLLRRLVSAVHRGLIEKAEWRLSHWKYQAVRTFEDYPESALNPEKAWEEEPDLFLASVKKLKSAFAARLSGCRENLPAPLQQAVQEFGEQAKSGPA